MQKKFGCDMRGMLSFQIMWILSKKSLCGEEIAAEIEKRRGDKPKAGTIYPALKELKANGVISGKKSGKSIVYSLTGDGRKNLFFAKKYFCRSFGDILDS